MGWFLRSYIHDDRFSGRSERRFYPVYKRTDGTETVFQGQWNCKPERVKEAIRAQHGDSDPLVVDHYQSAPSQDEPEYGRYTPTFDPRTGGYWTGD